MILKNSLVFILLLISSSIFGSCYVLLQSSKNLDDAYEKLAIAYYPIDDLKRNVLDILYMVEVGYKPENVKYYMVLGFRKSTYEAISPDVKAKEAVNHLFEDESYSALYIYDKSTISMMVFDYSSYLDFNAKHFKDNLVSFNIGLRPSNSSTAVVLGILGFDNKYTSNKTKYPAEAITFKRAVDDDQYSVLDTETVTDSRETDFDSLLEDEEDEEMVAKLKDDIEDILNKLSGCAVKPVDINIYNEVVDRMGFDKIKRFDENVSAAYVIMSNKNYSVDKVFDKDDNQSDEDDDEPNEVVSEKPVDMEAIDAFRWKLLAGSLEQLFKQSDIEVEYIPLKDTNPAFDVAEKNSREYSITKEDLSKFQDEAESNYDVRIAGYASNMTLTLVADKKLADKYPNVNFGTLTYHKVFGGWFRFHGLFVIRGVKQFKPPRKSKDDTLEFLETPADLALENLMVSAFSDDFTGEWRDINNTIDPVYRYLIHKFIQDALGIMVDESTDASLTYPIFNLSLALINSLSLDKKVNKFASVQNVVKTSLELYNQYDMLEAPVVPSTLEKNIKDQSHELAIAALFMAYKRLYREYSGVFKLKGTLELEEPDTDSSDGPKDHLKTEDTSKSKTNVTEILLYAICSIIVAAIVIYGTSKCLCKQKVKFLDFYRGEESVGQ